MSDRRSTIDRLVDEVGIAVESPENQVRGQKSPTAAFYLEEPIVWARLFGYDVNEYIGDPEFYFEQTLRQKLWRWANFPDDDLKLTMDIPAWLGHYPEYTYVGMCVRFDSYGVPILQEDHPISCDPDIRHLKPVDFYSSGWMPRVLKWHEQLNAISAGRMNVTFNMTWWRGCLDLAIQLRGYENFMFDTVERPEFIHDLLRFLVEQRCRWHEAYWKHFGLERQKASIGDDWINVPFITPSMFEDFVLPRYLNIEKFHGGITDIHSCGNQAPVQKYLLMIKSLDVFEVGPWTDLEQSLVNIPPEKRLGVGLHPNDVLCASPEEMETRLKTINRLCEGRQYDIGTSGLSPISDDANKFINTIRTWTRIARDVMIHSQFRGGVSPDS